MTFSFPFAARTVSNTSLVLCSGAVAVGIAAQGLTYSDLFRQRQLLRRDVHTPDIVIVSAAGYLKEAAHLADAVFLPVTVDHFVFDACFHPFPVAVFRSKVSFPLLGASFSVEFYIIPRYNIVSEYRLTQSP